MGILDFMGEGINGPNPCVVQASTIITSSPLSPLYLLPPPPVFTLEECFNLLQVISETLH